jgi:hypothetical protein
MGCNAIVAEETTITGSIGVVAILFKLRALFEKIGYVARDSSTRLTCPSVCTRSICWLIKSWMYHKYDNLILGILIMLTWPG